ncbi:MAG: DUF167 domain-containing protein [Thermoleophilia bacterium]
MLSRSADGTLLSVRVIPGAKKSKITGEAGGLLRVRLQAPPVEGKANRELLKLLARELDLKKRQVVLVRGEKSREKTVLLAGVTLSQAQDRLKYALREE